MDSTEEGRQPLHDASFGYVFFFMLYIFLARIFLAGSMILGVIHRHFLNRRHSGVNHLSAVQRQWVDVQNDILQVFPHRSVASHAAQ